MTPTWHLLSLKSAFFLVDGSLDPLGIRFTFFPVNGALHLSTIELVLFIVNGSLNLLTPESKFSEGERLDMLTEVHPGRAVASDSGVAL